MNEEGKEGPKTELSFYCVCNQLEVMAVGFGLPRCWVVSAVIRAQHETRGAEQYDIQRLHVLALDVDAITKQHRLTIHSLCAVSTRFEIRTCRNEPKTLYLMWNGASANSRRVPQTNSMSSLKVNALLRHLGRINLACTNFKRIDRDKQKRPLK